MKLKKRNKKREFLQFVFIFLCLFIFTGIGIGYSYLQKDLGSTGKISIDMKGPLIEIMKRIEIPKLDSGVNFKNAPSASNGQGLMLRSGTEDDTYPIYYYRGDISNNYVKFANVLWKIVRTTEKGGVKLIYYAEDNGYGYYVNRLYDSYGSFSENSVQNSTFYGSSLMYPSTSSKVENYIINGSLNGENVYVRDTGYIYSTKVSYNSSTKMYTLSGSTLTMGGGDNAFPWIYNGNEPTVDLGESCTSNCPKAVRGFFDSLGQDSYHYTCLSTDTSCSKVYYIFDVNASCGGGVIGPECATMSLIPLTSGATINSYVESLFPDSTSRNVVKSSILTSLETWYKKYLSSYSSKLEAAVWCNNRDYGSVLQSTFNESSIFKRPVRIYYSYYQNYIAMYGGLYHNPVYFGTYYRVEAGTPAVKDEEACPNIYDRFTASTSSNGNGKLSYKIGLLTADETMLMGEQNYYNNFYTMSPDAFGSGGWAGVAFSRVYAFKENYGKIYPAISIVLTGSAAFVNGGDGSFENPYIIN